MQQRKLGASGPSVGAIGLGCMSFGGAYGPTDEAESHRTLALAHELGVNHLDTSNIYGSGRSEEVIGTFLKTHPGRRFSIATKGGIRTQPTRTFDNAPAYLRECLEGSLRRLGVEHVDLYYIHRREQARQHADYSPDDRRDGKGADDPVVVFECFDVRSCHWIAV